MSALAKITFNVIAENGQKIEGFMGPLAVQLTQQMGDGCKVEVVTPHWEAVFSGLNMWAEVADLLGPRYRHLTNYSGDVYSWAVDGVGRRHVTHKAATSPVLMSALPGYHLVECIEYYEVYQAA